MLSKILSDCIKNMINENRPKAQALAIKAMCMANKMKEKEILNEANAVFDLEPVKSKKEFISLMIWQARELIQD